VYLDAIVIEEDFENDFEVLEKRCKKAILDIEYKKKAVKFWHSGKTKNVPLKSVQHRFRKVSDLKLLYRWEAQIKQGGTRIAKLLQISKYVLEQFKSASDKSLSIHDIDLKRWALRARDKVDLSRELFTASKKWVHNFKAWNCIKKNKKICDSKTSIDKRNINARVL